MKQALAEAVASSSAHGISRAAGTNGISLKVMWILLFLVFLGLFIKSGINLVKKLNDAKPTKTYHLDQVPFEFPDLYFCPANPYSGSYPFILSKSEVEEISSKISGILSRFKKAFGSFGNGYRRAQFIQASLPFEVLVRYMTQRIETSVIHARLIDNSKTHLLQVKLFYHPENIICFSIILSDEHRQLMRSKSSYIEFWLSTDPYFSEFNFTGHPILPIVDNETVDINFVYWHPIETLQYFKLSGYCMLIVPRGTYPSIKFENQVLLAPGNAYIVELGMEENACSEDLHKALCVADHSPVLFTNPMTGKPESFDYSSSACYYQRKNYWWANSVNCQQAFVPMLWEFHDYPVCQNLSTWNESMISDPPPTSSPSWDSVRIEAEIRQHCASRIPCTYPQYSAKLSSCRWPSAGGIVDYYFLKQTKNESPTGINPKVAPALAKVAELARQLQSGNYTTHTIDAYRSYLSESMLRVGISASSAMSPQVLLTWSYTFADFLSDIGGLLGLYIGCSLLTVCELLELLYIIVKHISNKRLITSNASLSNVGATDQAEQAIEQL